MPKDVSVEIASSSIDDRPAARSEHRRGIILCALAATWDGMDAQAMALVASTLMREWAITPERLGMALSAAPLGMVIGALVMGAAADRFGRRPAIIASLGCVGLFSIAIALATTVEHLVVLRLLAGFGMGGVVSNVITLTAELSDETRRARNVAFVFSSVPFGAMIAAMLAVALLTQLGWRGLFVLWGSFPLLLLPLLVRYLPESPAVSSTLSQPAPRRGRSKSLFASGRALQTLTIWIGLLLAFQATYFLSLWLPTLLERAGFPARTALSTLIGLNAGAVVGGIALGWLMQRVAARIVVPACYVCAGLAAFAAAAAGGSMIVAVITTFLLGLLTLGGQVASASLISGLYPSDIRGLGVGWATGMGRVGAVSGPVLGGILLGAGWDSSRLLQSVAIVQLAVALLLWIGARRAVRAAAHCAASADP
jgi:MFS transporter, AAHS family, 4-hydroxybenzoate transporter